MDEPSPSAMTEAREYGRAVQDALRPGDPRLRGLVRLAHRDGTAMVLASAFVQRVGDWVYVFTRSHGFLVYPNDELTECKEYDTGPAPAGDVAGGDRISAEAHCEGGSVGFGDMPIHTSGLSPAGG